MIVAIALVVLAFSPRLNSGDKLWPGAHYTDQDRNAALERGLQFMYKVASNQEYFSRWGSDLMFCFYTISNTARNQQLREMARKMGQERARQWRREQMHVPVDDPDDLAGFIYGTYSADMLLGDHDSGLKERLRKAARRFSATEFLGFDPRIEPPPSNIPDLCPKCNHRNPRGARVCEKCGTALTFRTPYDTWLDALIKTHEGDSYGVTLGASYPEALRWISKMRPYPVSHDDEDLFDDVSYAVTHVVYTVNDYHKYRLSRAWLPQEFSYLRNNITQAERFENGELVGEFMDALRAFGEDDASPEIRAAMDYLLSTQNPDGSWGDTDDSDMYTRYHSTWTAIDGLRQYAFQGEHLRLPHRSLCSKAKLR
ncbi:MAG TPA: zinc-ribbon domain-containing protein [Candidatus Angelobacter sp.]